MDTMERTWGHRHRDILPIFIVSFTILFVCTFYRLFTILVEQSLSTWKRSEHLIYDYSVIGLHVYTDLTRVFFCQDTSDLVVFQ